MVRPKKGDIIRFPRGPYDHYGIYIGNGRIIHRSGPPSASPNASASSSASAFSASGFKSDKAGIRVDKLEDVAGKSGTAEIFNFLDGVPGYKAFSPEVVVERARSRLGEKGYNVLFMNCEHFVTWCRYGVELSQQVLDRLKQFIQMLSPTPFLISEIVQALLPESAFEDL